MNQFGWNYDSSKKKGERWSKIEDDEKENEDEDEDSEEE